MKDNNIPFNTDEYNMTINEFAKVCMTTRDTLRHYYEIGLLIPAVNPLNGYHYYSPSQVASFYYISSLKSSGCSLDEIASLMADSANFLFPNDDIIFLGVAPKSIEILLTITYYPKFE